MKPSNVGGGKEPCFWRALDLEEEWGLAMSLDTPK
jgi:hypothetical protein